MSSDKNKRKTMGKEKDKVLFPFPESIAEQPEGYNEFLTTLHGKIKETRFRTVLQANATLVLMYWEIGACILEKQENEGWGAKVIDRLSFDLRQLFPDMKGFSPRNLKYMRAFAAAWKVKKIVQEVLAQLSWYQNIALLENLKDESARLWYAKKAREFGWSHNILKHQIELKLFDREGKLTNNFECTLPPMQSDMAKQIFKDPYLFDFLGTDEQRNESDLEQGLMEHVQKFLLELGSGFAFVGRQMHLELGDRDFYLDLFFYHLRLRCFIVIELKAGRLEAGHISQLNMYMNAVDDVLRHSEDKETIGLLLVKQKDKIMAEYCLKGYSKPMGIAEWENQLTRFLPNDLKTNLPSIEEIEREFKEDFS